MALEITWNFKTLLLFAGCGMVLLVSVVILLAFCICWPKRKKQGSKAPDLVPTKDEAIGESMYYTHVFHEKHSYIDDP